MTQDQIIENERRTGTVRRNDNSGLHSPERRHEERRRVTPRDVTFMDPSSIENIDSWLTTNCKGEWKIVGGMPTLYGESTIISFKDSDDKANFINTVCQSDDMKIDAK